MRKLTESDKIQATNLLKIIKRGKYELAGEEVLAFGQMFGWIANMINLAELDIEEAKISSSILPETPILNQSLPETPISRDSLPEIPKKKSKKK